MDSNIKVRINDNWVPARDYQIEAFKQFKNNNDEEYKYDNDDIAFTISRRGNKFHGGTYITRSDATTCPISDWNDVKVFLLDVPEVGWYEGRDYQVWAYFDFIYSDDDERFYKSNGTKNYKNYHIIQLPLPKNIVFRISRNDNGTIFYERNDAVRTRIRISDNHTARSGYQGYYNRMTMDMGFDIMPKAVVKKPVLPKGLIIEKTLEDDCMCVVCNDNQQNIKFEPCNHTNTCSECYNSLEKNECPICKQQIEHITLYKIE